MSPAQQNVTTHSVALGDSSQGTARSTLVAMSCLSVFSDFLGRSPLDFPCVSFILLPVPSYPSSSRLVPFLCRVSLTPLLMASTQQ